MTFYQDDLLCSKVENNQKQTWELTSRQKKQFKMVKRYSEKIWRTQKGRTWLTEETEKKKKKTIAQL